MVERQLWAASGPRTEFESYLAFNKYAQQEWKN